MLQLKCLIILDTSSVFTFASNILSSTLEDVVCNRCMVHKSESTKQCSRLKGSGDRFPHTGFVNLSLRGIFRRVQLLTYLKVTFMGTLSVVSKLLRNSVSCHVSQFLNTPKLCTVSRFLTPLPSS